MNKKARDLVLVALESRDIYLIRYSENKTPLGQKRQKIISMQGSDYLMFSGLEKSPDSIDTRIEIGSKSAEAADKVPSMNDLRSRVNEIFPMPSDGAGKISDVQLKDIAESLPREITLDDGTVVTLPGSPDHIQRSAVDTTRYKSDDHGNIYRNGGELYPNNKYELNGNIYTTDGIGRIIDVEAKPTLAPETTRDNDAQKDVGGKDRKEGDQGGHIVGRDMGGDGGEGNLVAMNPKINQSDYKKMENDIKRALSEGKDVFTHTEISYRDSSERPDIIKVTATLDGKETVYTFDNNIDGALREYVDMVGGKDAAETVQSVVDGTDGEISSIKEEYDENNNLTVSTANITYIGEDGKVYRTKIIIDNPQGGKVDG